MTPTIYIDCSRRLVVDDAPDHSNSTKFIKKFGEGELALYLAPSITTIPDLILCHSFTSSLRKVLFMKSGTFSLSYLEKFYPVAHRRTGDVKGVYVTLTPPALGA